MTPAPHGLLQNPHRKSLESELLPMSPAALSSPCVSVPTTEVCGPPFTGSCASWFNEAPLLDQAGKTPSLATNLSLNGLQFSRQKTALTAREYIIWSPSHLVKSRGRTSPGGFWERGCQLHYKTGLVLTLVLWISEMKFRGRASLNIPPPKQPKISKARDGELKKKESDLEILCN